MVREENNKPIKKQRSSSPFDFLFNKIDNKEDVKIYLRNDEKTIIKAQIISFDAYTVLILDTSTKRKRLLFKHNIDEISEI